MRGKEFLLDYNNTTIVSYNGVYVYVVRLYLLLPRNRILLFVKDDDDDVNASILI